MSILLAISWEPEVWLARLKRRDPDRAIFVYGRDSYDPAAIRYALTWRPQPGALRDLPGLNAIFNLGAGVDALFADHTLPDVPIVRLVDDNLTARMTEWVTLQVLLHHRRQLPLLAQQRSARWAELDQPIASDIRVGFMGYGVLARAAADILGRIGYRLNAWSRTARPDEDGGVQMFAGDASLPHFLAVTDILVVLLPLTETTRGILNRALFEQLARDGPLGGPVLINAGRGGLQIEADIVASLGDGTLAGASLDVFQTEPLPADSPLWTAPHLVITPHIAAISEPEAVSDYVLDQIRAHESGAPLRNVVDPSRGY